MKPQPWKLIVRVISVASLMLSALCWWASNWVGSHSNRQDAEGNTAMFNALAVAFIGPPAVWFAIDVMSWYRRHYLKTFRRERGLCLSCGYDLAGNASGVCPECGTQAANKPEEAA